eukprot:890760-Pyramimonas_sp.AAC.1
MFDKLLDASGGKTLRWRRSYAMPLKLLERACRRGWAPRNVVLQSLNWSDYNMMQYTGKVDNAPRL